MWCRAGGIFIPKEKNVVTRDHRPSLTYQFFLLSDYLRHTAGEVSPSRAH